MTVIIYDYNYYNHAREKIEGCQCAIMHCIATLLRTSEDCILVKVLPTCEGFVVDATFLRTSEGYAFLSRFCPLVKVLPIYL